MDFQYGRTIEAARENAKERTHFRKVYFEKVYMEELLKIKNIMKKR